MHFGLIWLPLASQPKRVAAVIVSSQLSTRRGEVDATQSDFSDSRLAGMAKAASRMKITVGAKAHFLIPEDRQDKDPEATVQKLL
jgi:hypothetical protein